MVDLDLKGIVIMRIIPWSRVHPHPRTLPHHLSVHTHERSSLPFSHAHARSGPHPLSVHTCALSLQFSYGWTTTTAVSTSMRLSVAYNAATGKYAYSDWVLEEVRLDSGKCAYSNWVFE